MTASLDRIATDSASVESLSEGEICALIGEVAVVDARLRGKLAELKSGVQRGSGSESHSLLTVEEAAEQLAVTGQYVYELLRKGDLPGLRVGKYWRIDEGDLLRWIAKQKEAGNKPLQWKRAGKMTKGRAARKRAS
jgi:excisionase family DNA binding protein